MTRRKRTITALALTILWLVVVPAFAFVELSQRPPPRVSYFFERHVTPTRWQVPDSGGQTHQLSSVYVSLRWPLLFATLIIPIVAIWLIFYFIPTSA